MEIVSKNMAADAVNPTHAYLVSGGDAEKRERLIVEIAASAVCESGGNVPCKLCRHCIKAEKNIHPDIICIEKSAEKREILIDEARAIIAEAQLMPNEAQKKIFIIYGADGLNKPAQNALLKILEEPPRHVIFILSAENPAKLLPTVRSRTRFINVSPEREDGVSNEMAEDFFRLLDEKSDIGILEFTVGLESLSRPDFMEFIGGLEECAVQKLRRCGGADENPMKIIRLISKIKKYDRFNVNVGHMSGFLCASVIGNEEIF
jgi:hypothetical protein